MIPREPKGLAIELEKRAEVCDTDVGSYRIVKDSVNNAGKDLEGDDLDRFAHFLQLVLPLPKKRCE
jgi:hypothetical protein